MAPDKNKQTKKNKPKKKKHNNNNTKKKKKLLQVFNIMQLDYKMSMTSFGKQK